MDADRVLICSFEQTKCRKSFNPAVDRVLVRDIKQTKYGELRTKCRKSVYA